MFTVLCALILVLPTNNANSVNNANNANLAGWSLRKTLTTPANGPASHVAEYRRRVLSSDLETLLHSTEDDDGSDHDSSATLQFSEDELNKRESESIESGSVDANADETSGVHRHDGKCVVIEECAYCSDYKNDASDECKATGRRERIECNFLSSETSEEENERKYRSCRRTKKDDELLVMQLQLMCLLTSYFSLLSMRREKLKSVSLFDQRVVRRSRTMIPVTNKNPMAYTEVQQVENGCRRDNNMEDNILHKVGADGTEKLDNKF